MSSGPSTLPIGVISQSDYQTLVAQYQNGIAKAGPGSPDVARFRAEIAKLDAMQRWDDKKVQAYFNTGEQGLTGTKPEDKGNKLYALA